MIDVQLIEGAKSIRNEYIMLTNLLNEYKNEVHDLAKYLIDKSDEMEKYQKDFISKMKNRSDLSEATNHILKNLQEIEDEEKKLTNKVESVNRRMEKLREDEVILYETIKKRYPDLSDEEIYSEIQPHLRNQ